MTMLTKKALREEIAHKNVLLDTDVISRSLQHFPSFEGFFKFLEKTSCSPAYSPFVEFEFIRGAYQAEHREKRREFLKSLAFENIPLRPTDTLIDAIKIANIYAARKHYSASIVDCSIAAYLKQYSKNLFLVALNHKDYPLYFLDRIYIYPINTEKDIYPLAFYKFNEDKAKKIGLI